MAYVPTGLLFSQQGCPRYGQLIASHDLVSKSNLKTKGIHWIIIDLGQLFVNRFFKKHTLGRSSTHLFNYSIINNILSYMRM